MNRRTFIALLLLTGAIILTEGAQNGSLSSADAQDKLSLADKSPHTLLDCSFISPLDKCIQHRFTQTNRGFGVERIMVVGRGYHTPVKRMRRSLESNISMIGLENDEEKEAVAEIEESGINMVLYLASRKVLGSMPDESNPKNIFHEPLRGPVGITRNSGKSDWPEAMSLWTQAQKAMQDFESEKTASQYEFSAEGKGFVARPVRAQEACLKCHTPQVYQNYNNDGAVLRLTTDASTRQIKAGDPIGVLLYAYTSSAKSNNIRIP